MPTTTTTATELEACVEFLTEQLETLPEVHQRVLLRSDERGREVLIPARRYADNFKGRLVLRRHDADSDSWDVVTSTDKPRLAALFYLRPKGSAAMSFNPTHVWSYYVEGRGAAAQPVEVVHAPVAYGPYRTVSAVVRTADGAQHLAHGADVAPLSARARGVTA